MLIPIGFKNFLESGFIVEIMATNTSRAKRLRRQAAERGMLINAACGRPAQSTITLKSTHVVLSALQAGTIKMRLGDVIPRPDTKVHPAAAHPSEHECDTKSSSAGYGDRRREPERRNYSYTVYIPERRSGTDRRTAVNRRKGKRNDQGRPLPQRK
ncbi:MAG: DUF370 domain-containing protein [Desulfobacterales bacterium]|nr:MAG: DUF370 domain-containing protein [Desulfobacterales bacterium]